jgi:hypothetical protein
MEHLVTFPPIIIWGSSSYSLSLCLSPSSSLPVVVVAVVSPAAVPMLLAPLPLSKLRSLGGKLGHSVAEGVHPIWMCPEDISLETHWDKAVRAYEGQRMALRCLRFLSLVLGIETVGQLAAFPQSQLEAAFGLGAAFCAMRPVCRGSREAWVMSHTGKRFGALGCGRGLAADRGVALPHGAGPAQREGDPAAHGRA